MIDNYSWVIKSVTKYSDHNWKICLKVNLPSNTNKYSKRSEKVMLRDDMLVGVDDFVFQVSLLESGYKEY